MNKFLSIYNEFKRYIRNICIYSKKEYNNLKSFQTKFCCKKYNNKKDVIDFIKINSSENIKPFPIIKVKTYNDYKNNYKEMHSKISSFYGNLNGNLYKENIQKIKILINAENDRDKENILRGFEAFEIKNNTEKMDKSILEEYKRKYFFSFLNKKIQKKKVNDEIIYFTSRFMHTLNSYACRNQKYFRRGKVFIGKNWPFSSLLKFEKEKGKIIFFSDFKIATESDFYAQRTAIRFFRPIKNIQRNLFSVVLTVEEGSDYDNNNNISNGVVVPADNFSHEEIILLPFSFYLLKDIIINYNNSSCDIMLKSIGSNEILENKIKLGKSIVYNERENIMEVED